MRCRFEKNGIAFAVPFFIVSEISEWERASSPGGETAYFTRLSVQIIYAASAAGENAIAKGDSQPAALPQEHQEKEEGESTGGRKEKQQLEADRN